MPIYFTPLSAQADVVSAAQTFYRQFFVSGGPIVWFILLPMSIVMVYLAIDLLVATRRNRLLPSGLSTEIATHAVRHGLWSLPTRLAGRSDLISNALLSALEQGRTADNSAQKLQQRAGEALQESGLRLSRKTQWLQVIGTIAPMVGLFGTVYGMICAFHLLGQGSEGPRYELLADSISVALVTTFWGLLIAIPAQFFYSGFQTRIETLAGQAALETEMLLERLCEKGVIHAAVPAVQQPVPDRTVETEAPVRSDRSGPFIRRKSRRAHTAAPRPMMKRSAEV